MTDIYDLVVKPLHEPRWLYLATFAIMIFSSRIVSPITQNPTQMSIDYYNVVVGAESGDVVLFDGSEPIWNTGVYELTRTETLRYWYNKGVCVIFMLGGGTQAYDLLYAKRVYNIPADQDLTTDPYYGTRLIVVPSGWMGDAYAAAANFRAVGDYDAYGIYFDDLPGVKAVKNARDIYCYLGGVLGGAYLIAFGQAYGVKCIAAGCGGSLANRGADYGVGLMHGLLIGTRGSAEFDQMLGLTGTASQKASFAELSIALWTFSLTLFYNIMNQLSMRSRKRPLQIMRGV